MLFLKFCSTNFAVLRRTGATSNGKNTKQLYHIGSFANIYLYQLSLSGLLQQTRFFHKYTICWVEKKAADTCRAWVVHMEAITLHAIYQSSKSVVQFYKLICRKPKPRVSFCRYCMSPAVCFSLMFKAWL